MPKDVPIAEPISPANRPPKTPTAARPDTITRTIEISLVPGAATRQLGVRIAEDLAMRLDLAATRRKLSKRDLPTVRAIIEDALETWLKRNDAA